MCVRIYIPSRVDLLWLQVLTAGASGLMLLGLYRAATWAVAAARAATAVPGRWLRDGVSAAMGHGGQRTRPARELAPGEVQPAGGKPTAPPPGGPEETSEEAAAELGSEGDLMLPQVGEYSGPMSTPLAAALGVELELGAQARPRLIHIMITVASQPCGCLQALADLKSGLAPLRAGLHSLQSAMDELRSRDQQLGQRAADGRAEVDPALSPLHHQGLELLDTVQQGLRAAGGCIGYVRCRLHGTHRGI